jgi:large subunit ribosomal protein L10
MDRSTKHAQAAALKESLEEASAIVLLGFDGLSVAKTEELRGKFREAGCTYKVYKNSVIRYAVEGTKHEPVVPVLKGSSGLAYHLEDPGAPARVARDFLKDHEDAILLKGGVMEGTVLDASGVERLAAMPGPNELKAQLLALLNTPATQFVRVLNASATQLLNVLNARKDKLEEGGEAA